MPKLEGVAVVSGGGQGIGRAVVRELLTRGAKVVFADVDAEAGRETALEYRELGEVRFIQADVSQEDDVRRLVAETVEAFGGLTFLVSNAGVSVNKPLAELSLEDWNRVLAVNLTGAFLLAKHAAPHLGMGGVGGAAGGAVVNIASTRAGMSERDTEAYSASKGGLVALTHALAMSLGPEVRVNAVSPGWIEVGDWQKASARSEPEHSEEDRAQHPVGRVGVPEDVAAMVAYLLSSKSGFITGQNFIVDGGMTRKMIYH